MAFDAQSIFQQIEDARISLRVRSAPLILPGRRLFGAWDPLLRQIDIFDCNRDRSDRDLVRTLLHELSHALSARRDEAQARRAAEDQLDQSTPQNIGAIASRLREMSE
ncbi:MAG: hypothetical protein SF069_11375 [Phycisphaerae bacterium]|nr:hypothetical protein [Phycisphaerae bacterium]